MIEIIGGFVLIMVCLFNGKEYVVIVEINVVFVKYVDVIFWVFFEGICIII